mgnify:CR=1 FL=1
MTTKEIQQAEKEILTKYKNGNYSPLGADGGSLKYIMIGNDYGTATRASITIDSEIAKIKSIWQLTIDGKEIYDHTTEYYKLRV